MHGYLIGAVLGVHHESGPDKEIVVLSHRYNDMPRLTAGAQIIAFNIDALRQI